MSSAAVSSQTLLFDTLDEYGESIISLKWIITHGVSVFERVY